MERVGVIGVGRMGQPRVKHLLKRGFAVSACDIDAGNLNKARDMGGTPVDTPAELGRSCSFVILGVGYDEEVNAVTLGANGVLETLAAGSIIAVSSTVAPDTVKALDEKARARGCDVLDAPICRGRWFADEGKLLALFGGRPDVVQRGRAVYSAFSSDIAVLGEVGHGQAGKALNNLLLWVN